MVLTGITLHNYRCYADTTFDSLERLAIFIGENDAGKTVLLDAVEVLLGQRSVSEADLRREADGTRTDGLWVRGVLRLEPHDRIPVEYVVDGAKSLCFTRRWSACEGALKPSVQVSAQCFEDSRFDGFRDLSAQDQKQLLKAYGVSPGSNSSSRHEQVDELLGSGTLTRVPGERGLPPNQANELNRYLPRTYRISSTEYRSPAALVQRTLQEVANSVLMPIDATTGTARELPQLADVRKLLHKRFAEEVKKATPLLQQHHGDLRRIRIAPQVDFARAVQTPTISLDCGAGEQTLESFGEGTKKRIWMGLLEWERQTVSAHPDGSTVRLYDEPDANLHYEAQRQLFENVRTLASKQARTQCLVCTHSVTLIDRAPYRAVNLVQKHNGTHRTVRRITGPKDEEVIDFLSEIGQAVGLTNTVLLYERGFLVVEGDSEYAAIPIIYRTLFGCTMREDGIVLVNLHTCSAWRSLLETLLWNRIDMVHLLLDADCLNAESSGRITVEMLRELKCSDDFIKEQVTFIGGKEFEDAFDTTVIASALNTRFPRQDDQPWENKDLDHLKQQESKFSEDLRRSILQFARPECRSDARKPTIAAEIAKQCHNPRDVPEALYNALKALRERARIG